VADVAIEVLISSRSLTVPEVSGDATYTVPDIQATAIRLKDSAIIGQAAASDILGRDIQAGRIVKQFGVREHHRGHRARADGRHAHGHEVGPVSGRPIERVGV